MNLPESFQDQMKQLLKEEYEQYIQSFEQTRVYGLRVNTSKISTEKFEQICPFSVHKIPWISNGYYYEGTEVGNRQNILIILPVYIIYRSRRQ